MEEHTIYRDIAERTNGDIYIGVVGPVRTGKSTFIKKFMDTIVIPNIDEEARKDRAVDELPQSAAGRTIMTTEPKFIPEQAVQVHIGDNAVFSVRLIDCVGYIVPSALGYVEGENPRMVMTPWFDDPVPFNMAAEIGTKKVITEHSTIGLVVTTDGSISDIPREEYEDAEERVITELREIHKPFIVLLNSTDPGSAETQQLAQQLEAKYAVPVLAVNCLELEEKEIRQILSKVLFEFPIQEIRVDMPHWVSTLEKDHWLRSAVYTSIRDNAAVVSCIREMTNMTQKVSECEYVDKAEVSNVDLGTGKVRIAVTLAQSLFYKVLGEKTGLSLETEEDLLDSMMRFADMQKEYDKIKDAYHDVQETGYGIVMPSTDELTLEEPRIVRQGGKYGIRLKATAPSIHMMKTQITTEITPIVGSQAQSEELVSYILKEFEENPSKIWESNIFGKSLHELVNEGMHNKLYRMPQDAREKVRETIERIINDGCNGLICIIL
ncbi:MULTISPECIES: stage IV sporulation protein A [Caproicibacterium]|jgi:stage IV sporulation protein A|uniref:Stage IV sporulation protein A n=1 Tax=Caproicibacterium lactatifermentans TaxID=2666138 RepID=A0A859DUN0_9FIRM|nr:stage IV sporulation protein A [Caproicibacterium lactatifermentans]ARP50286.1 stage IV sporulation protein A [Ruminococcaceae bacterium CPB6]MDD4807303.1 stage IV sporulation protein A [Oscillospiraceae bacterium]QKN23993.1 stage IV sporulation protein A [Caproicibacterium lactatifermentans]QKO30936.1 stage IV sporulation protein A [Caproicibacterium lactatifermentans]